MTESKGWGSAEELAELRVDALGFESHRLLSNILTYEVGMFVKSLCYADAFKEDARLHLANAQIELADIITQGRIFAAVMGWDYNGLVQDGAERFRDRMEDVRAQAPQRKGERDDGE